MSWLFEAVRLEKYKYEDKVASIDGIVTTGQRFQDYFDLIQLMAGWNFEFRFLLDLFLNLYGHVGLEFMDWFKLDLSSLFPAFGCAKYDVSVFGECVYDPPDLTGTDIERLAWDLTYHTTEHDSLEIKLRDKALRRLVDAYRTMLIPKGITSEFFDVIEQCIAVAEAKLQKMAYWGVAVWGGNVWGPTETVEVRDIVDWISELINETLWVFENWWGWGRWGYARWMDESVVERIKADPVLSETLSHYLDDNIKAFHEKIGPVYSTVRRLRQRDQMAWEGGGWIPQMGYFRSKVKQYLKKQGLSAIQYGGYMSFALEVVRLGKDPQNLYKTWKRLLTPEDLVEKYVNQGLNRDLLNDIKRLV